MPRSAAERAEIPQLICGQSFAALPTSLTSECAVAPGMASSALSGSRPLCTHTTRTPAFTIFS